MRNFCWHCYITGAILIALGIFAFTRPMNALVSVGFFIGCGLVASGINHFTGFYLFRLKRFIALGLLDILIGVVMILQPGITAFFIPLILALWLFSTGMARTCSAFWLGGAKIRGWWLMLINGIALIISALLVFASPLISAISVMMILGCVLLVAGVLVIAEGRIMSM